MSAKTTSQGLCITSCGIIRVVSRIWWMTVTEPLLGRGYTGHEHLDWFGLINMNARLYDPSLGRFLSPDPHVQAPDFSQNFNRYSYCLNNPLKYTVGCLTLTNNRTVPV